MRSYPEIGIWELVSGTPCFGPHRILRGQNPLTAWYLGPNTSSLAVRVRLISFFVFFSPCRALNIDGFGLISYFLSLSLSLPPPAGWLILMGSG